MQALRYLRAVGWVTLLAACLAGAQASPRVAIDIGHSLAHPGSISARGLPEFVFNQALGRSLAQVLAQRQLASVLIGEDGHMTVLTARTQAADAAQASFFLSLHHDSAQLKYFDRWVWQGTQQRYSDRFSGFSLFVSRLNPMPQQSLACARTIGSALLKVGLKPSAHHAEPIAGENREWADPAAGVYYFDDLVVLKTASTAAVLLEAGLIVNRNDELALQDPEVRHRIATATADGLLACQAIP